jgi:predicted DNA-binding transcriptional regulator YafY
MSATDQLERLLYMLPRAAQPGGARIDELSNALGVKPETIMADIEEATTRVFYHPAGHVDAFELTVEQDTVKLFGKYFDRPVRLTEAEAMALSLGLRVLAAEGDAQRRSELLALAHTLEQELVTPDLTLAPLSRRVEEDVVFETASAHAPLEVAFEEDDFRGDIAEAIEARVYCDVVYLKAGGSEPSQRHVAPVRLVYTRGHWYMRAFEKDSQEVRSYRLDRIMRLRVTDEQHTFSDIPADAPTFATDGGQRVAVRYSPKVARWVAEREKAQVDADGSLSLTHDVVDMNWLVRHVLQYGGEAVVETADAREVVAKAASQLR